MILATTALTNRDGSQFVLNFVYTFKQLNDDTSLLSFLIMLTEHLSSQMNGTSVRRQTPQIDIFPHLATMVCNTKK
jgi:hypothetical protein